MYCELYSCMQVNSYTIEHYLAYYCSMVISDTSTHVVNYEI